MNTARVPSVQGRWGSQGWIPTMKSGSDGGGGDSTLAEEDIGDEVRSVGEGRSSASGGADAGEEGWQLVRGGAAAAALQREVSPAVVLQRSVRGCSVGGLGRWDSLRSGR